MPILVQLFKIEIIVVQINGSLTIFWLQSHNIRNGQPLESWKDQILKFRRPIQRLIFNVIRAIFDYVPFFYFFSLSPSIEQRISIPLLLRHLSSLLKDIFGSSFIHDTRFRIVSNFDQFNLELTGFFEKVSVIQPTRRRRANNEYSMVLLGQNSLGEVLFLQKVV